MNGITHIRDVVLGRRVIAMGKEVVECFPRVDDRVTPLEDSSETESERQLPVMANGVIFETAESAASFYGVSAVVIRKRIRSEAYPEYHRILPK